jgi:predicted aspartyl protease
MVGNPRLYGHMTSMPTLTIKRARSKDAIHLKVLVFGPSGSGGAGTALFDTGNDHTVISKAFADSIGLSGTGRGLSVHGVTGGSMGTVALVTLGIEFDGGHKVTVDDHEVVVLAGASDQIMIGRDFLERFDVTITRDGTFKLEC